MALLAASEDPPTLLAMQRAEVWPALVRLVPPVYAAGERNKVELGARAIFERVARRGTAAVAASS